MDAFLSQESNRVDVYGDKALYYEKLAKQFAEEARGFQIEASNSAAIATQAKDEILNNTSFRIIAEDLETNRYILLVGANIGDIGVVAGNLSTISVVAGINQEINTIVEYIENINTVYENLGNINVVATDIGIVNSVADNILIINAVANNETNINAVNANKTNINTVASKINNINFIVDNYSVIQNVNNHHNIINSVYENTDNINKVSNKMPILENLVANEENILTCATRIDDVVGLSAEFDRFKDLTLKIMNCFNGSYQENENDILNGNNDTEIANGNIRSLTMEDFELLLSIPDLLNGLSNRIQALETCINGN